MRRALPSAALSNMLTVNRHIVAINSAFDSIWRFKIEGAYGPCNKYS
jgi:hypothetical protein